MIYTMWKFLIIQLVNQLNQETESLNKISYHIESLAAIAEENSASSEEDLLMYLLIQKKLEE